MCGFLFSLSSFQMNEPLLRKSLDLIKYRGPDDTNFTIENYKGKKIFLGHNRLSIVDINKGSQPMIDVHKKYSIIYNGEIYNHNALRDQLINNDFVFKSNNSDTEVILNGYKKWGANVTDHLNGMWSFIIFDRKNSKIFLSRDRFGEKPLFFFYNKFYFSAASEISTIKNLHSKDTQIDPRSLMKYCAYGFFPKSTSPYKNILQLDAGSNLIYDIDRHKYIVNKYWDYKLEPDTKHKEVYWTEKLYNLLDRSVEQRLQADTEVGTFLSGGLDSSIITHFASKNYKKKLKTFSINFENKELNEKKYSEFISKKYDTDHYDIIFNKENSLKYFNDYCGNMNDLISDSSLISYYQLCKLASEKVKVILGGDASDELFAGYTTFNAFKIAELLKMDKINVFPKLMNFISRLLPFSSSSMNLKFKLHRFGKFNCKPFSLSNPIWLSPLSIDNINKLFDTKVELEDVYEDAINTWNKSDGSNFDKVQEFYINFFLKNQTLVKIDRLSMRNGLEIRSPFLDIELVDCIRKIPSNLKLKKFTNKYILKKTFENIFGKKFTYRKKVGLTAPISDIILNNTSNMSIKSEFLNKKKYLYEGIISDHMNKKGEKRLEIWNILSLDKFLSKYET